MSALNQPCADGIRPPPAVDEDDAPDQRPEFPHGYEAWAAAFELADLLDAMEEINGGSLTREGQSIAPMIAAAKSLAKALGRALDRIGPAPALADLVKEPRTHISAQDDVQE